MEIHLAPSIQISAYMSLSVLLQDPKLAVILGHISLSISQEPADATTMGASADAFPGDWPGRAVSWGPGGLSWSEIKN